MRGISSVGRALRSHRRGQGFEFPILHHLYPLRERLIRQTEQITVLIDNRNAVFYLLSWQLSYGILQEVKFIIRIMSS